MPLDEIHRTREGVVIGTTPGKKGKYDFRVQFKEPGGRARTPSHVHIIVEMYVKEAHDRELTYQLRDHLVEVFDQLEPIDYYPPKFQLFDPEDAEPFMELDEVGEFSTEFLLATTELIMIQEKTNYPRGSLTAQLYKAFGRKDRFSVIQAATFRGSGRRL